MDIWNISIAGMFPRLLPVAGGRVVRLRESNLPVGLLPNAVYQSAGFHLRPGDRIILVTDGVTEAEGPDGDFFGDKRLETFAATGMTVEEIFNSVRLFCVDRPISDDCTLIGVDYHGQDNSSRPLRQHSLTTKTAC